MGELGRRRSSRGLFAAASPELAEGFLQLDEYDWYLLVGRVRRGVLSTPGGIAPQFEEWRVDGGCPTPAQPDDAFDDDPYALDPE